jgi:hypothetical protein
MQTQAYFENIQEEILNELSKTQESVIIAVAWFTDTLLFESLCRLASKGIKVQLLIMNDEINNSSGINFEKLNTAGGKVYKIGDGSHESLMHNKFCVIDGQIVINGSYNWTNKARQNHESITVINDKELALKFIVEFNFLKRQYIGEKPETPDYSKICIRLKTLKNAILLEDGDDIKNQAVKIEKTYSLSDEGLDKLIRKILDDVKCNRYSEVVKSIDAFVGKYQALNVYIDPEIEAIKLEIKVLEIQISSLEDEKTEIEKLLFGFEIRYNKELGELLTQLLYLRKENLRKEAENNKSKASEAKEAEDDYANFKKSVDETRNQKIKELSETEEKDLKTLYRKASKLCHPDVVEDKYKDKAEQIFRDLQKAYETNDIDKVNEILASLEKGLFANKSEQISKKKELQILLKQLRLKREDLEKDLVSIRTTESYKTVSEITDWDAYFEKIKRQVAEEIKNYDKQLKNDGIR